VQRYAQAGIATGPRLRRGRNERVKIRGAVIDLHQTLPQQGHLGTRLVINRIRYERVVGSEEVAMLDEWQEGDGPGVVVVVFPGGRLLVEASGGEPGVRVVVIVQAQRDLFEVVPAAHVV